MGRQMGEKNLKKKQMTQKTDKQKRHRLKGDGISVKEDV